MAVPAAIGAAMFLVAPLPAMPIGHSGSHDPTQMRVTVPLAESADAKAKPAKTVKKARRARRAARSGWSPKIGPVGTSTYGPYEGECITATGRRITGRTRYVAVPIWRVTSKSRWKRGSSEFKRQNFYYHQKIRITKGGRSVIASVEDCGGFGSYTSNGYLRYFDMTPAVSRALHAGTTTVRFQYRVG